MIDELTALIKAQDEYIALLEKSCGEMTQFASRYGVRPSVADIEEGIRLRQEIRRIKDSF